MRPSWFSLPLMALALAGCSGSDKDDTSATGDDTASTGNGGNGDDSGGGDTNGGGNGGGEDGISGVTARISDKVATVPVVDWTVSGSPSSVWVEYGTSDSYGMTAPVRADVANEAVLLGLAASTTVHFRVGATFDSGTLYSDDQTIDTGTLPSTIPTFTITTDDTSEAWGNYMMTAFFNAGTGYSGIVILSRAGDVIWYTEPVKGFMPAARPSRDGLAVHNLTYPSVNDAGSAEICRIEMDGEPTCTSTPYAHHDFWPMPDDNSYCYPMEEARNVRVGSSNIDLVGDDLQCTTFAGDSETKWSAFDDYPPEEKADWDNRIQLPEGLDWTHVNGMWFDEDNEDFYLSFYYDEEIRKIPASNYEREWTFGGVHNEFTLSGGSFGPQHAPQWVNPGTMWLFDNDSTANGSRVQSWNLDTGRMTASLDTEIAVTRAHALVMGDAHKLASGYIASAWGDAGEVTIFTADGTKVWEYSPAGGVSSTQVYVFDDMYHLKWD